MIHDEDSLQRHLRKARNFETVMIISAIVSTAATVKNLVSSGSSPKSQAMSTPSLPTLDDAMAKSLAAQQEADRKKAGRISTIQNSGGGSGLLTQATLSKPALTSGDDSKLLLGA